MKFPCVRGTFHQLSVLQRDLPSISINFPCVCRTFHQLSVWGPSVNFRQHFECLWVLPKTFRAATGLPSTSVNFLQPLELHSTFCASVGPSVHFPCICRTFRQLPSTLSASAGPCIKFLCVSGTFSQLSVRSWYLPSVWSALRVCAVPSVNFHQYFVHPWDLPKRSVRLMDLPSTSVNYPCGLGTYCQLSVHPRDLQSTFWPSAGSFINFQCGLGTFRQHFWRPWDLPSTSVNFPCLRGAFGQLSVRLQDFPSTFPVARGPSVNFSCVRVTLSTSVNFMCIRWTLRQFSCICGTVRKLLSTFCASRDLL